jgi:hypothetical protein
MELFKNDSAAVSKTVERQPLIDDEYLTKVKIYSGGNSDPIYRLATIIVRVLSNSVAFERKFRDTQPEGKEASDLWGSSLEYFQERWSPTVFRCPCIAMGCGSPDPHCCKTWAACWEGLRTISK